MNVWFAQNCPPFSTVFWRQERNGITLSVYCSGLRTPLQIFSVELSFSLYAYWFWPFILDK